MMVAQYSDVLIVTNDKFYVMCIVPNSNHSGNYKGAFQFTNA